MIRLFRPWGVALLLAFTSAVYAATWVGGRGPGNAGALPRHAIPRRARHRVEGVSRDGVRGHYADQHRAGRGRMSIVAYGAKLYAMATDTGEGALEAGSPGGTAGRAVAARRPGDRDDDG